MNAEMNPKMNRPQPGWIDKRDYVDESFAKREAQYLWSNVWQIACRTEEIPNEGDFITYDVANESLIIVRTASGTVKAFHNSCPHRGRRLVDGHGSRNKIVCGFHGWRWNIDGENTLVVDREDWGNCLSDSDAALKQAKVGEWGGFIFVNMDLDAEELDTFLDPINARCSNYEFEKLRYRWYKSVVLPCNWKIGIEAFDESYHAQTTHPQVLNFFEDYSVSGAFGRHGAFWYPVEEGKSLLRPSSRLGKEAGTDFRQYILQFVEEFHNELGAMVTPRAYEATQRLRTEVAADASAEEVLAKWGQFQMDAAEADGAGWPPITLDDIERSYFDWHMFPNTVFLHSSVDGVLLYRTRPWKNDPDQCLMDVWSLVRYAPGTEPPLTREFYANWRDASWGRIFAQDFQNLEKMQQGVKSMGFVGSRTNPVQEIAVANFHRALHEFIEERQGQTDLAS